MDQPLTTQPVPAPAPATPVAPITQPVAAQPQPQAQESTAEQQELKQAFDINKLFKTALQYGASDLYLSVGIKPTLRIHGELFPIEQHPILSKQIAEQYLLQIMNEHQKQLFMHDQDIDFAIQVPGVARFRANVFVQSKGIAAVFRLISSQIKSFADLGLPDQLKKILDYPNGLVLVTGPTGSGKSTTLAAFINEINLTQGKHIITIEDPIEYIHENKKSVIEQREIGTHTKTFQSALRASLREDPDVILVGELRDLETISLAITAAETGHLVFGTLHTSGCAKSVDRIIDVFPTDQQAQIRVQVAELLRVVVWQNLLPRADKQGRVAALEIMFNNYAIANLIRKEKTYQIQSALEIGVNEGMQSMNKALQALVEKGLITQETANKYSPEKIEEQE